MHINRTVISKTLPERSTPLFTATLVDNSNVVIPFSNLDTLTMTLSAPNIPGKPIINKVENVDIKNTGRGTINSEGVVSIVLTPDDMVCLSPQGSGPELHRILLQWKYLNTSRESSHEIDFNVVNIDNIVP